MTTTHILQSADPTAAAGGINRRWPFIPVAAPRGSNGLPAVSGSAAQRGIAERQQLLRLGVSTWQQQPQPQPQSQRQQLGEVSEAGPQLLQTWWGRLPLRTAGLAALPGAPHQLRRALPASHFANQRQRPHRAAPPPPLPPPQRQTPLRRRAAAPIARPPSLCSQADWRWRSRLP